MTKKVVSIVLAVMMVAAMMSVMAVSASAATISVATAAELVDAVAAASSGDTIKLTSDIDFTDLTTNRNAHDSGAEIKIDLKDCTLDLNGKTITSVNASVVYTGNGATIENGSFKLNHVKKGGTGYQAGSYGLCLDGYGVTNSITLNNLDIEGGVNIWDADVVINNVSAETTASKYYAVWAEGDSNVVINSGTFTDNQTGGKGVIATGTGDESGAAITVNDGTFTGVNKLVYNTEANAITVNGGSFDGTTVESQVSTYIAAGKDTVVKDGVVYVANEGTDGVITTAEELVAAAAAGGNYVLGADIETSTSVVIPEGKSMTLDLGNYSIEANVADFAVVNNGTLVITGNDGCIYNTELSAQRHGALCNYGTATVNGGHYGDKDTDMTNANPVNRGAGFQNYGTATVNGGYFTACDNFTNAPGTGSGYAYAIINYGTTTINDATVYGYNNGNLCNNTGSMTVNGGNYTLTKGTKQNYYSIYNDDTSATTVVNDGTFTNTTGTALTWSPADSNVIELNGGNYTYTKFVQKGSPVVSGGTFSQDVPVQYLANTVETELVGENYVVVDAAEPYVARIGSQRYTSLEAAVAAAASGATITLIDDIDYSTTYTVRNARDNGDGHSIDLKDCTLDLNGHTISTINATVTFAGNGATIKNGTFALVPKNTDGSYKEGSYALIIDNVVAGYPTTATVDVEDVVCNGAINICGSTTELNNVSACTTPTKFYAIWAEQNAKVTVNSGTFTDNQNKGKGVIATGTGEEGGATIEIKGGTFTGVNKMVYNTEEDAITVKGGTFSKDVDVYAADGFVGTKNSDGTYGVKVDTNPLNGKIEIEGYQNKVEGSDSTSDDGNDINTKGLRILTKVDNEFLADADDYGYVVAKVSGKAQASAKFDLLTADKSGGNGQKVISCKGTVNNGIDGVDNTYVTLAVNGMNAGDQVAARFYVVKDGTYYSYYVGAARYNGIIATMH